MEKKTNLINIQGIEKLSAHSRTTKSITGFKFYIEVLPASTNTLSTVHSYMVCQAPYKSHPILWDFPSLLPFLLKIAPILGFPSTLLYLAKHINKAKPLGRQREICATAEFSKTRETVLVVLCLLQSSAQQRAINKPQTAMEMHNENVSTQSPNTVWVWIFRLRKPRLHSACVWLIFIQLKQE